MDEPLLIKPIYAIGKNDQGFLFFSPSVISDPISFESSTPLDDQKMSDSKGLQINGSVIVVQAFTLFQLSHPEKPSSPSPPS